jgi:hypothetical protein
MKLSDLKKHFLSAIRSRMFVSLWILLFIQALVVVILVLTHPHSGLTIQTHCDVVGSVPVCTSAEASWAYIYYFAGFAILVFTSDILISLRLFEAKGRRFTLAFLWISVAVMIVLTALVIGILHTMGY